MFITDQGQQRLTTTDAKGRFVIMAASTGPLRVTATWQNNIFGGDYMVGIAQAQGGDTNAVVRLGIANGNNGRIMTMSGTVTDASGAPVSGVRLWGETPFATGFVMSGLDGKYSITWEIPVNNQIAPISRAIYARDLIRNLAVRQEFDESATNLDLHLGSALTLSVKVEDVNGKPLPTATAFFSLVSGQNANLQQTRVKADEDGIIQIKGLVRGLGYKVNVTARGYGPGFASALAVETQTNLFNFPTIVLHAADRKLAGTVSGPDGKPVAGASVSMNGPGQLPHNATTDKDGHFAFDAVSEGTINLSGARQVDFIRLQGNAQAKGGETNGCVARKFTEIVFPRFFLTSGI